MGEDAADAFLSRGLRAESMLGSYTVCVEPIEACFTDGDFEPKHMGLASDCEPIEGDESKHYCCDSHHKTDAWRPVVFVCGIDDP